MAKIELTPAELLAQSGEMQALCEEYGALMKQTAIVLAHVNDSWSDKLAHNFEGKLTKTKRGCESLIGSLGNGAILAKTSAETFQSIDDQLAKAFGGSTGESSISLSFKDIPSVGAKVVDANGVRKTKPSSSKKNTSSKKGKDNRNPLEKFYDDVCAGVAKTVDAAVDGVEAAWDATVDFAEDVGREAKKFIKIAYDEAVEVNRLSNEGVKHLFESGIEYAGDVIDFWSDAYKEKGNFYKVVQTGKAVVTTIGSISAIVASLGATAGTGGAAVPLAIVTAVHGSDAIANSFADIYNCWFGDVEKVGKTKYLKDSMTGVGEYVGGLLGLEEVGSAVGEYAYAVGKITTIVNSLSLLCDKATQLDDIGAMLKGAVDEAGAGIKGLLDIAFTSDISNVAKDIGLLTYEVPNIVKTFNVLEIINKAGESGSKIGGVINDFIEGVTGKDRSADIWDAFGWEDGKNASEVTGTIKDLYEIKEKLEEIFGVCSGLTYVPQ